MKIKVIFFPLVGPLIFTILFILVTQPPTSAAARSLHEKSALYFVENTGQFDPGIYYQAQTPDGLLQIAKDGLWWTLTKQNKTGEWQAVTLHSQFQKANWTKPAPLQPIDTTISYFTPDGFFPGVPVWTAVQIPTLYPGLDLNISSENGRITLQFITTTAPGSISTPTLPHLQISGATLPTNIESMTLSTPLGDWSLPITSAHGRLQITLSAGEEVQTLVLSSESQPPTIHPVNNATSLIFSTFIGGTQDDQGNQIIYHTDNFIYTVGEYLSIGDFPRPVGRIETLHDIDAYVAKIFPDGSDFDFIFHIMAELEEAANDFKISSAGEIYVAGRTSSADFPTTPGAYDESPNGSGDVWLMKIRANGSTVAFSTVMGRSQREWATGLDIDSVGDVYITGITESPNFPTTPGAYDETWNGDWDAFVAKFDDDGADLIFSTFIGGTVEDSGQAIDVRDNGEIYVAGYTVSGSSFPSTVTIGPTGGIDAFAARLTPAGDNAVYVAKFGGSQEERGMDLVLDNSGRPVIVGFTSSNNFPTTAGVYDQTANGSLDAFVVRIASNGSGLGYATYLGGSGLDKALGLTLDDGDNVYVTGETNANNFPLTANAYDSSYNGGLDIFLTKLNPSASALLYGSYIGGANIDSGRAVAVECENRIFVTGLSASAAFPVTAGVIDSTYNGGLDVVLFKLQIIRPPAPTPSPGTMATIYLPAVPHYNSTNSCPA